MEEKECIVCSKTYTPTSRNQQRCGSKRLKTGCSFQHSINQKKEWTLNNKEAKRLNSKKHNLIKKETRERNLLKELKAKYEHSPN